MDEVHWAAYEAELAARPSGASGVFVSLDQQLANVRRWNAMRRWGFAEAELSAVDLTPRGGGGPLVVDVVAVYLPGGKELDGVRRTCDELWLLAADQQPESWCWDDWYWNQPDSGRKPVRLLDGIEHVPGVRRVTLDLGAHWMPGRHVRPLSVLGPRSAHAEVLAAAAHFPSWVRAMDGRHIPYAWLAGYQVTVPKNSAHHRLPCLAWIRYRNMVSLASHEANYSQSGWAAPTCLGQR